VAQFVRLEEWRERRREVPIEEERSATESLPDGHDVESELVKKLD
jgi:hypothetical protein